ncbi:MAG: hypothetical protein LBE75_07505, partial [Burkholderiales bacterium]|nr:hypothetical protein [Burkholderiales bacterium]
GSDIYRESHKFLDEATSHRQYKPYGKAKSTKYKGLCGSLYVAERAGVTSANLCEIPSVASRTMKKEGMKRHAETWQKQ